MMYSSAKKAFCKIMEHKKFGKIGMCHCRIEMYHFEKLSKLAKSI